MSVFPWYYTLYCFRKFQFHQGKWNVCSIRWFEPWNSLCNSLYNISHNSLWPIDVIWWSRLGSTLAQVITWTHVHLSSLEEFYGTRPVSQEVLNMSSKKMSLKNTCVKLSPHLSRVNELRYEFCGVRFVVVIFICSSWVYMAYFPYSLRSLTLLGLV